LVKNASNGDVGKAQMHRLIRRWFPDLNMAKC
jgi:hypothetical protein